MRRLVEALNACWRPHFPGRPEITLADFKRDIRERQVWCSSCMIAFDGAEPIGVLIGAKRPTATLVDTIAIRPDRVRQEHGRHLLESLGAKLEILGPPLITAEVPDDLPGAAAFFGACGYTTSGRLTDWTLDDAARLPRVGSDAAHDVAHDTAHADRFIVPQGVADLAANGLLVDRPGLAWDRGAATLTARAERLAGFALATVDRIDAFALYRRHAEGRPGAVIDILASTAEREEGGLTRLLRAILDACGAPLLLPRVSGEEHPEATLRGWGFVPGAAATILTAGRAA